MNAIRIRRRLEAPIAELPELAGMVGKDVEIIVLEEVGDRANGDASHFKPVGRWDGPAGEFDELMREATESRDADAELDRGDGAP